MLGRAGHAPGHAVTPAQLKDLYARKASALARRPVFARGSRQARVRLGSDLRCDIEHPAHTLVADAAADDGGQGLGPDPGELMSASVGASLAMSYRLWAARLDVPIEAIEVTLLGEHDERGQLGSDDIPVGWQRLVITVSITSPAPEAAVRQVVEVANRRAPMLANLSPAIERVFRLSVTAPGNDPFPRG